MDEAVVQYNYMVKVNSMRQMVVVSIPHRDQCLVSSGGLVLVPLQ